jgi:hypothetical protein
MAQATIKNALEILGKEKVILASQYAEKWKLEDPGDVLVRYDVATILQVAEANLLYGADWRLVYLGGNSLVQQHALQGGDITESRDGCYWWLGYEKKFWIQLGKDTYWAEQNYQPGYHLINVRGLLGGMTWDNQEKIIAQSNKKERCWEEVLSELIITVGMITGEKICHNWVHWGRFIDAGGCRVGMPLSFDGYKLGSNLPGFSLSYLRVALFQKFDFLIAIFTP